MTLFELIFILLFLGSVIGLLLSPFFGRTGAFKKILLALVFVWGVYFAILAVTDVLRVQQVFKVGEDQCFDEMCFAVSNVQTFPERVFIPASNSASRLYIVKIRITSHSRGRAQAEGGLRGRLFDGGAYINVSETAQKAYEAQHGESPRLTQRIAPGESVLSVLAFEVPQTMMQPELTLDHGFTPGYFVIGEPFLSQAGYP